MKVASPGEMTFKLYKIVSKMSMKWLIADCVTRRAWGPSF